LESVRGVTATAGSNPALSAKIYKSDNHSLIRRVPETVSAAGDGGMRGGLTAAELRLVTQLPALSAET